MCPIERSLMLWEDVQRDAELHDAMVWKAVEELIVANEETQDECESYPEFLNRIYKLVNQNPVKYFRNT